MKEVHEGKFKTKGGLKEKNVCFFSLYCHLQDAVKFMLFFLYPFRGSDNSSFPFNIPQDSSPLLRNPKPSPNKQKKKNVFNFFFFIHLNLQTLVLHSS